jgi:Do/DeqQ family serine protease
MTAQTARTALMASVLFAFAGIGFGVYGFLASGRVRAVAPSVNSSATADALQAAFVSVAERVRPAVVNVGTVQVSRGRRPPSIPGPGTDDPFLKDFFDQFFGRGGQGPREEFKRPGIGSGVIIDKRGFVLTNNHVILGADSVTVKLSTGDELKGRIVGTDSKTDLAVVKFEPAGELRVAKMGDSDTLRVGEWAIAIGNPFGLDQTVTVGVVSATGRAEVGLATYENFIQTDASINPGNSGGPLLNLRGEVIGINTAIFSQSGGSIGIGFAIPINMVKRVVDQLVDKGKVVRGWLGVSLQPLSPELAESLGVPGKQGAVVGSTMAGSPAATAGLVQNDVILAYDKTPVESSQHFQRLTAESKVGSKVVLQVFRKKQKVDVTVTVGESPDESPRKPAPPQPKS